MIRIEIETDNEAFFNGEKLAAGWEVARILHDLANKVQSDDLADDSADRKLFDANGNTVGKFAVI